MGWIASFFAAIAAILVIVGAFLFIAWLYAITNGVVIVVALIIFIVFIATVAIHGEF